MIKFVHMVLKYKLSIQGDNETKIADTVYS